MDRACLRTITAWPADPAPRALCRSGARAQPRPGLTAAQRPDAERDDRRREYGQNPKMLADVLVMRQAGIVMQRRDREHARQYMRQSPRQDRGDVDAVEPGRRHPERTGRDWHEGADRR